MRYLISLLALLASACQPLVTTPIEEDSVPAVVDSAQVSLWLNLSENALSLGPAEAAL